MDSARVPAIPKERPPRWAGGESASTGRLMRLASYASIGCACTLIAAKFVAWQLTGSISLLATLIDSLLDALASTINLLAVRHALTPPDEEHRFGHGKAEPLAALAQAAFICGSALFLLIEAGGRILHPQPPQHEFVGIAVMTFSILLTLLLIGLQSYVIRRSNSLAIAADSLHYRGDLLTNLAVIVALLLSAVPDYGYVDPLIGIGIAAYIVYNAWRIGWDALDMLMDKELPASDVERIVKTVFAHPHVCAVHDLRTRASGPQTFIQCHVELQGGLSLRQAHEITDTIEHSLRATFPRAEVIIHQDPYLEEVEAPRRILRADYERTVAARKT